MADFDKAYSKLKLLEGTVNGGYVKDPADPGGETYAGIARRYWPDWSGWPIVDGAKVYADFPATLERDALASKLASLVRDFYHREFWTRSRADLLPDGDLATEVLEQAVNLGLSAAVRNLQTGLNALNDHGRRWPDVKVDGMPGTQTTNAAFDCHKRGMTPTLRKALNVLQGAHYLASRNERFIRGWLDNRVTL